MKRIVTILIFMMIVSSSLLAVPYTLMGNINIPDAYILPHKMAEISMTGYMVDDPAVGIDGYNKFDYAGSVRFGLLNKLDVGLVYASPDNIVFGNVKLQLISETDKLPALSIGIANLFCKVTDFEKETVYSKYNFNDPWDYIRNSPYVVISKSLVIITGVPGMEYLETTFHGGMGSRKFQGKGETVKTLSGVFGGIDIKPSKYWGMDIEFDSQNINLGLNAYYQNLALRAGLYEVEDFIGVKSDLGAKKIAFNLTYTLDTYSDVKAAEKKQKTLASRSMQSTASDKVTYKQDTNPLREELEQIRKRRKQAEKELAEIRKLLEE